MNNCGRIIILNGCSASGKSSLQKAFQQHMLPDIWLKLGIDILFDQPMPDINQENMHLWQKPNDLRWVKHCKNATGHLQVVLHTGLLGDSVAYAMNRAIAVYAMQGCDIIVDYIAYKKAWLDDLSMQLHNYTTFWVGVTASLESIEQREALRGTSPAGHARSHYNYVLWDKQYDIMLDTTQLSCVDAVALLARTIRSKFV